MVRFESVVLAVEHRPEQALLRHGLARGPGIVTICGWCKRVSVLGDWLEIEDAIATLPVFEAERPPNLSHGICEDCGGQMMATVSQADRPREEGDAG